MGSLARKLKKNSKRILRGMVAALRREEEADRRMIRCC